MKKVLCALAGMALTCSVFVGSASALTWAICTTTQIGPNASTGYVLLQVKGCNATITADPKGFMHLDPSVADQQMATILTAMSLGKPVSIGTDGTKSSAGKDLVKAITLAM